MPRAPKANNVAVYQGDDLLCVGTVDEVAEKLGIKPRTIRYYLTPTYKRRSSEEWGGHGRRCRHVVAVDDD